MAVEKVWKCDLCGEYAKATEVRRVHVRRTADRPEDAEVIDVGPECHGRTVSDVLVLANSKRAESGHVE